MKSRGSIWKSVFTNELLLFVVLRYAVSSAMEADAAVSAPPVATLPLRNLGYQYAASLTVDGVVFQDFLVDTGSSLFAIRDCYPTESPNGCYNAGEPSDYAPFQSCSTLLADGETILFKYYPIPKQFSFHSTYVALTDVAGSTIPAHFMGVIEFATTASLQSIGLASGIMGMGMDLPPSCSTQPRTEQSVFYQMLVALNPRLYWFSLDFNLPGTQSTLALGGYDEAYTGVVVWSEQAAVPTTLFQFMVYDLELCEAPMMAAAMRTNPAFIDTSALCLTLPAEMFDAVTGWLPLVQVPCPDEQGFVTCRITSETLAAGLPSFSFRLSQDGDVLILPLLALVLDSGVEDGGIALCLRRGQLAMDTSSTEQYYSLGEIVFGSMAVRALYTVINIDEQRVGFANKNNFLVNEASCNAKVECADENSYDQSMNKCLVPPCSSYIMATTTSHGENGVGCELSIPGTAVLWTLGLILLLLDIGNCLAGRYWGATAVALRRGTQTGLVYRAGQRLSGIIEEGSRILQELVGNRAGPQPLRRSAVSPA